MRDKAVVVCLVVAVTLIGCGSGTSGSSPNVITKSQFATLDLKHCSDRKESPESQIGKLVSAYNDKVCAEKPWQGYLLSEDIVRRSIEVQLGELPENRRKEFESLLKSELQKEARLEFFSDVSCEL